MFQQAMNIGQIPLSTKIDNRISSDKSTALAIAQQPNISTITIEAPSSAIMKHNSGKKKAAHSNRAA